MAIDSNELKNYLKQFVEAYKIGYEIPRIMGAIKEEIKKMDFKKRSFPLKSETPPYFSDIFTSQLLTHFDNEWRDEQNIPQEYKIIKKPKPGHGYEVIFTSRFSEYDWGNKSLRMRLDFKDQIKNLQISYPDVVTLKENRLQTASYEIVFPNNYAEELEIIYNKARKSALTIIENYPEQTRDFNSKQLIKKQADAKRIERLILKKELLEQELSSLDDSRRHINDIICTFREFFPKQYRSFSCVSFLYDCIMTGRCTELTGPFGAFQRYEEELKANKIIDSLTRIEGKLDQVIYNQNAIAHTFVACSSQIEQAIKTIDSNIQNRLANIEANQKNNISESHKNQILSDYKNELMAIKYNTDKIAALQTYIGYVKLRKGDFTGYQSNYPQI